MTVRLKLKKTFRTFAKSINPKVLSNKAASSVNVKMGKVKKLKPNTEEEESRTKEKKLNSNENQSYSSGSPSSDSPFSSSDSSDEEYQRKRKRKSKKSKKRSRLNCTLITETISTIENKIGICPECRGLDDEGPMIGCDSCDTW